MIRHDVIDAHAGSAKLSIKEMPLVHCITNYVTMNDCANALLAIGASPIMGSHRLEVEEITRKSHALVLNMGATEQYESMRLSLEVATMKKIPIIIDPVGVGASTFRREQTLEFIKTYPITVLRGNASELRALWLDGIESFRLGAMSNYNEMDMRLADDREERENSEERMWYSSCGVDVSDEDKQKSPIHDTIVKELASVYQCIVIMSGEIDLVSDGIHTIAISGGSALMPKVTGMGCMSTALLGAVLGNHRITAKEVFLEQEIALCINLLIAMKQWGYIGEQQLQEGEGLGTFKVNFFDALSQSIVNR